MRTYQPVSFAFVKFMQILYTINKFRENEHSNNSEFIY